MELPTRNINNPKTLGIAALVLFLFGLLAPVANAQEWIIAQHRAAHEFMVSGVLRAGADGMTIKLIQSYEVAQSEDEAIGAFTKKALELYPGYSVLTTLVSPLKRRAQDVCGTAI